MYDASRALADMASQIRVCRSTDGLTLQQLAARSGVAASTIHKVEARQMVPTVSVLLKIAKGLGRRPEELIRDHPGAEPNAGRPASGDGHAGRGDGHAGTGNGAAASDRLGLARPSAYPTLDVAVWDLEVSQERALGPVDLRPDQRAILMVEHGRLEVGAGGRSIRMGAGDCIEIAGGRIELLDGLASSARLRLIVSPRGDLEAALGAPRPSAPVLL